MSAALFDFVPVWTLILGAGIFFYVLLDGFDLGVGMLYGFMPDARSRNTVMNAIAPVWDGNETWLVLGGLGLLAAFPLAFAIIVPALYFPIAVMLLALVFRGVAFEFRFRDAEHRTFWDHGFFYGSLVATVAQGVMLGAFIQGFRVDGRVFAGSAFDFLTPFSVLTGIALVFGYGLLGAGWLVLKTEGEIQERARHYGRLCLAGVLVAHPAGQRLDTLDERADFQALVLLAEHPASVTSPHRHRARRVRHVACALRHVSIRRLHRRDRARSRLSYAGIAISLWPMIVPHHYTLWQAASSPSTQAFLLVGTLFLLPVILVLYRAGRIGSSAERCG